MKTLYICCYYVCTFVISQDIAGYKGKIPVAVKTLTSRDPDIIQKFVEEAELMKKFTHPNIVSLLGERYNTITAMQASDTKSIC